MTQAIWLFGYGSILWRPDVPYTAATIARLSGFQRRFWQASTDHRGTLERPGAVATLRRVASAQTLGIAYCIEQTQFVQAMTQLDQREQNGYSQQAISLTLDTGQVIQAITYIAQPGNPWDLGSPNETVLAEQIQAACGPSGTNLAYFQHLRWASQCLNEVDDHLERIASALTRLGSSEPQSDALVRLQIEKALVPWHPLMR